MLNTLKPYLFRWKINTAPGFSLKGAELVFADSEEEAQQRGRENVHDRAFPDLPLDRIDMIEAIEMKR